MAQVTQIECQLEKTRWNEGSAFPLPVYLRLRSTAAAATPTTIHYRIDCLTTGREIADWTSVSAASNFTVAVTGAHNAILNDCNPQETKQLTVEVDKGLATQHREAVQWIVTNLYGSP
jgi:hypothetical protein